MSSAGSKGALIGVDWGTSSLRAYLIGRDGAVLDEVSSPRGILHVAGREFASVLDEHLRDWTTSREIPVIASGMVTSRNGWLETPYLNVPCGLDDLANNLTRLDTSSGLKLSFVTGVTTERDKAPDVMRGEETQILGAVKTGFSDGVFVTPGTHSKWVTVNGARIEDYATYMTGEVFNALKSHTILGKLMVDGAISKKGFQLGLDAGLVRGDDLLHELFNTRTLPLFGRIREDMASDYLSGLLIGAEIGSANKRGDDRATLIGRGDLVDRYEIALRRAGFAVQRAPENVAAQGHFLIAQSAGLVS